MYSLNANMKVNDKEMKSNFNQPKTAKTQLKINWKGETYLK